jgi:hypothetical protein
LARAGLKAILAHGHDGSLYRAERGEVAMTKLTAMAAFDRSQAVLQSEVTAARVTVEDAGSMWAHLACLALHKARKMVYTHQLSSERQEVIDRHPELIARFLGE